MGILLFLLIMGTIAVFWLWEKKEKWSWEIVSPLGSLKQAEKEKPLEKYSFENLKERGGKGSEIKLEEVLKQEEGFTAHFFSYISEGRKITGLANLPAGRQVFPKGDGKFPVIVMIRGYVDQEDYQTGVGTRRAGEFFARHGFLTLAPDFLGYGGSDMPPDNVWEERFLKPVAILDLIASIKSLPQADSEKICLWGHSNGGMVALSVLAISQGSYPTTLWAPVSQFFPYDILYFTDEFEDKGKALRKSLADFEKDYDVNDYSFNEYLEWIQAPLLIHQGAADEFVPVDWSDKLVTKLKEQEIEIDYHLYPGADHNLKGAWEQVVQRDLRFFQQALPL